MQEAVLVSEHESGAGHGGQPGLRFASARGRWVLVATVLGSGMAQLDATVVNVALPSIGRDLHAGAGTLQLVVTGYSVTLAALILLSGTLGDRLGRRRVFVVGVVWFAAASLLCAVSPTVEVLIGARLLQGIGGALLTPGSLAIIDATFVAQDRGRAIGAWSALGGVAAAIGPLIGGYLVQAASWRAIFVLNLPLGAVVAWLALRQVPESRDSTVAGRLDYPARPWRRSGWPGRRSRWSKAPPADWVRRWCSRRRWSGSSGWSGSSCVSGARGIPCCRWRASPRASSPRRTW